MKVLVLAAACLFSITCFGQTKLISFKSHSGNKANFRAAVEGNLFDIGNSNFGTSMEYIYKIDKITRKSDNKIIVQRRIYSRIVPGDRTYKITESNDTLTKANAPGIFYANNIDSLKTEIYRMYKPYQNAKLDSTQFIGFEKQFKQKKASQKK